MAATISPTEVAFYADHDSAALHEIVHEKTADSMAIYLNGGSKELAGEALAIANAAWGQLLTRGEV